MTNIGVCWYAYNIGERQMGDEQKTKAEKGQANPGFTLAQ